MMSLTRNDVGIAISCEPERFPFVRNCSAITHDTDRRNEDWVRDQLDAGNEWAWCIVSVRVHWETFEHTEYLGACSYRGKTDFVDRSGYYADMVDEGLAELNQLIEVAYKKLQDSPCWKNTPVYTP